jgi:quercetin 2,3-dioxygenase
VLLFKNDGESLSLATDESAHVILLSGEPIEEPIVQYGPFVMNSVDEIRQAMIDVNTGKFGPLPD